MEPKEKLKNLAFIVELRKARSKELEVENLKLKELAMFWSYEYEPSTIHKYMKGKGFIYQWNSFLGSMLVDGCGAI